MRNAATCGVLVCDTSDKVQTHDEAYAVTTTPKAVGACARSIFVIERADDKDGAPDNSVYYGQDVRFVTNSQLLNRPMYLSSSQISPTSYARFSRNQEVCVHSQKNYNTVWKIHPASGNPKDKCGSVVGANDALIFEHAATKQYLLSDKINYANMHGNEYEVSALCAATKSKTQILANENKGTQVRENTHKAVPNTNHWCVELSNDPSAGEPVVERAAYDADAILADIKAALLERGSMAIRGIGRVFRILDDNRNRQLDAREMMDGLKDFGVMINED